MASSEFKTGLFIISHNMEIRMRKLMSIAIFLILVLTLIRFSACNSKSDTSVGRWRLVEAADLQLQKATLIFSDQMKETNKLRDSMLETAKVCEDLGRYEKAKRFRILAYDTWIHHHRGYEAQYRRALAYHKATLAK